MSPRMFLLLSDRLTSGQLAQVSPSDVVIVGPGIEQRIPPGVRVMKVPMASSEGLREVADTLARNIRAVPTGDARDLVACLLNDCYAYAIRPAYSTLEFLKKIIDEEGIVEITMFAARRRGGGLPLVGFRTTESPRGSRDLLGAFIAQAIKGSFPGIPINVVNTRGDFYCVELLRKSFMLCANLFFMAMFSLKCIVFLKSWRGHAPQLPMHGIIVRVPHQARFAARILFERRDTAIFAFPQASQGSLRSFGRLIKGDLHGLTVRPIRLRELLAALLGTVRDIRALGSFARVSRPVELGGPRAAMQIDFSDLARELMIFPTLVFYKNLLAVSVTTSSCKSLVTFELVGRMAGIESLVARQAGIPLTTVQTALVSATPHVVFPWSGRFLTDGPEVADQIEAIGSMGYGSVQYAGSTFNLDEMRGARAAREVGFFTQPYEPMVTVEILRLLCEIVRGLDGHVYLKLHPRDDERIYKGIISRFRGVLKPVTSSPDVLLEQVDLCVTRTSSVAKQAIAAGIPVVLCLWTKMDKSIRADYVRPDGGLNYCSFSAGDLQSTISDFDGLKRAAVELRGLLFGDLDIRNLRAELFDKTGGACRAG